VYAFSEYYAALLCEVDVFEYAVARRYRSGRYEESA
jgi:hypothetical protein